MWIPRKFKFKKNRRGRSVKVASNASTVFSLPKWGEKSLVAKESCVLSVGQLESARRVITTGSRRGAKVWRGILPDVSRSKKPKESRMGKGKGAFFKWESRVPGGSIIFEYANVQRRSRKPLEKIASSKLPVKTRLINFFF